MTRRAIAVALALSGACVSVTYQRSGERITPRAGQALVFGRVRFVHDGHEFFPWSGSLHQPAVATRTERHLWLLRLGRHAISTKLQPDADGSLAIWLAHGDYALLGSVEVPPPGLAPYEVLALVRVPAGPVAVYVGDLTLATTTSAGRSVALGELGEPSVMVLPIPAARLTLEQQLGTLPEDPVLSPWCAGAYVPRYDDREVESRATAVLDAGCGCAVLDRDDPARVPIYATGVSPIGFLTLGRSTSTDAARLLQAHGGLGPARENQFPVRVGSAALQARVFYMPPRTLHQLYFENDVLVLAVSGLPQELPRTRQAFVSQYPEARETRREAGWYELQTPLNDCIWLVAVFCTERDRLDSYARAWTCSGAGLASTTTVRARGTVSR